MGLILEQVRNYASGLRTACKILCFEVTHSFLELFSPVNKNCETFGFNI